MVYRLDLPLPPSENLYRRHLPHLRNPIISQKGRAFLDLVRQTVSLHEHRAAFPLTGRLEMEVEVVVPDLRRRDLDNFGKALLDGCSHGGLFRDDSQVDDLRFWRTVERPPKGQKKPAFVRVAVRELAEGEVPQARLQP